MKEAMFYEKIDDKVRCHLCPRECTILKDKFGFCGVRKNVNNKLYSIVYEKVSSINIDPIEKKPFFHFYPGSRSFSIGTIGCNFTCPYCCNWEISQERFSDGSLSDLRVEDAIKMAKEYSANGFSFTYNEPTTFYEYAYDIAKIAKENNFYTNFVTNGFINEEPIKRISKYLDAAVIDFKGFNKEFYRKFCGGDLEAVLNALKTYYRSLKGIEITNLVIPGYNDDLAEIIQFCSWIKENLSDEVPIHFIAFFPSYKMMDVKPTPYEKLKRVYETAKEQGLKYVYLGNVPGSKEENTYCPNCNELLIKRYNVYLLGYHITKDKKCPKCGEKIPIFGEPSLSQF
ncbi:MAG: AmmeMemoRadiSam system radical SAM enzyme [Candidatus Nanoarchaeia archaeon]|nr:AmmeMemoRadiSam system radical SAM enzyme [Candidatus Jingweiarchaeum tengchongense]